MYESRASADSGLQIYHATPIHFLPEIFACGELRSQSVLGYSRGRVTARKRDRRLSVDQFVHFSLSRYTPLIGDKLRRGYSHVVLEFAFHPSPEHDWAVLPMNTKAWRSAWQCCPVFDDVDRARLVRLAKSGRRMPSLEVLVTERFPIKSLTTIHAPSGFELEIVRHFLMRKDILTPVGLEQTLAISDYDPKHKQVIQEFFDQIESGNDAFPAPQLPFD